MKKLVISVAVCLSVLFVSQASEAQIVGVGLRGGLNMSSMTGDISGIENKTGYNIGLILDVPVSQNLFLQPGISLTNKGYNIQNSDLKCNATYLEVPVMLSYSIPVAHDSDLRLNAGSYMAYGIDGKDEPDGIDTFTDGNYKKFDCGLGIGAGMNISKFYIGFNYEFGLVNVNDGPADVKTSNLSLNIGCNF